MPRQLTFGRAVEWLCPTISVGLLVSAVMGLQNGFSILMRRRRERALQRRQLELLSRHPRSSPLWDRELDA